MSTPSRTLPGAQWHGLAVFLEPLAVFAAASTIGFALLVALFKAGVLAGIPILFYRGLSLIAVAGVVTLAVLVAAGRFWPPLSGLRLREALSAAMLSVSLNLSFLVLFPVTVDRSITVFVLGYMASQSDRPLDAVAARAAFETVYLGDYRQIERRFEEQLASGNIKRAGDGYVLSAQGRRFLDASRAVAWMFDIDTRFVAPQSQVRQTSR